MRWLCGCGAGVIGLVRTRSWWRRWLADVRCEGVTTYACVRVRVRVLNVVQCSDESVEHHGQMRMELAARAMTLTTQVTTHNHQPPWQRPKESRNVRTPSQCPVEPSRESHGVQRQKLSAASRLVSFYALARTFASVRVHI
jgi:hypothetical protein